MNPSVNMTIQSDANQPAPIAPLMYFFSGVQEVPEAWQERFSTSGPATMHDYPQPGKFKRGNAFRLCRSGPGGTSGLLACPYTLPDNMPGGEVMRYDTAAIAETVEIETGTYIMVSRAFNPYDFMRVPPLLSRVDPSRMRGITMTQFGTKTHWIIPCCLPQAPTCGLPRKDTVRGGSWVSVPRPEYRHIAEIAETLYRAEQGEIDPPSREWLRDAACDAIAINYELTPAELGAIGILDDANYVIIASCLTDLYERQATAEYLADLAKKKNTASPPSGSSSTDSGEPDTARDTSRQPMTST